MKPVLFNGKFYSGGMNGVHRVADRLIRGVDAMLAQIAPAERPKISLIAPAKSDWLPELANIALIREASPCGQVWEQTVLPRKARGQLLVNLCNLAPIAHRDKILMLHDAQFLFPDSSYPWRQRVGYRLLAPRMARTSRAVLTVSDYSRQMLDLFGVSPTDQTHVLYNGVDHILETPSRGETVSELGLDSEPFVVMFGSEKAYKNNRVVFEAFSSERLDGIRLVVVGASREKLENASLPVPSNAVFAGRIDDAGLRALYEKALCMVFPSRTEGFGLPPAEAALCGCPSVVAPAGAIPEICRDAVAYADVDDFASWIEAILRYREDDAYRTAKVQIAAERMKGFTWHRATEDLLGHILRLAKS